MTDTRCALWYWSHGSVRYSLHDDELDAARSAVYMADDGDYGSPAGVQRADGTYTARDDWTLYKEVDRRMFQEAMERVRADAAKPQRRTVRIRPPFDDQEITVYADEAPSWLGAKDLPGRAEP